MNTEIAFRITDTWRAAFVPVGVLAAGILTLTGVVLTLRNARKLARDERLWNRQADLYVSILEAVRNLTKECEKLPHSRLMDKPGGPQLAVAQVIQANINDTIETLVNESAALASQEVDKAFAAWGNAVIDWLQAIPKTSERIPPIYLDPAVTHAHTKLRDLIHSDLHRAT